MRRTVQITADGSQTMAIEAMNVTYHSRHGAVRESMHVFIDAGLRQALLVFPDESLHIFEMGFGTGLNALLTLNTVAAEGRKTYYHAVDKYPLQETEWTQLEYERQLNLPPLLHQLHAASWNQDIVIAPGFTLHKSNQSLEETNLSEQFHLVYFDAFAPAAQPELWTETIFRKLYASMCPQGILVTYCSKGDVRRAMLAAGFSVTRIPGPLGKREMLRAIK